MGISPSLPPVISQDLTFQTCNFYKCRIDAYPLCHIGMSVTSFYGSTFLLLWIAYPAVPFETANRMLITLSTRQISKTMKKPMSAGEHP